MLIAEVLLGLLARTACVDMVGPKNTSSAHLVLGMPGDMLAEGDPGDVFSTKVGGQLLCPGNMPLDLGATSNCRVCGGQLSLVLQAGRHISSSTFLAPACMMGLLHLKASLKPWLSPHVVRGSQRHCHILYV